VKYIYINESGEQYLKKKEEGKKGIGVNPGPLYILTLDKIGSFQ
jgi:hypothetical protein